MYLWSLLHQCKKRQCNMMCNENQFAEKMCFYRVRFTVSLKRNSGSTNGQMTSLRPPAASVSSQTGAGQAVDYLSTHYLSTCLLLSTGQTVDFLSTCLLLSTGQAVDNNAACLSGQRSRDPIIRIHPI